MNQVLNNISTISIELILTAGSARVSFKSLFVIKKTFLIPIVVLNSCPKISMATNFRGPAAGKI